MTDDETTSPDPLSEPAAGAPHSTRFKPGQSGNPSGRPKMSADVKEALRVGASVSAVSLVKIAKDTKHPSCVRACEVIFDRLFGKAVAAVANPDGSSLFPTGPTADNPLTALLARLERARSAAATPTGSSSPEPESAALSSSGEAERGPPQ